MAKARLGIAAVLAVAVTAARAEPPPRFPAAAVWHQEISTAQVHPDSATMISTLSGLGGFGNGRMQIDFGLHVVHAPADAPTRTIVSHPWGYYLPDCEPLGTEMPVPDWAVRVASNMTPVESSLRSAPNARPQPSTRIVAVNHQNFFILCLLFELIPVTVS